MKSLFRFFVMAVSLLAIGFVYGKSQREEGGAAGLLAPLRVGQRVLLKETAEGYTVRVKPALAEGTGVVEVGPDYLAFEEPGGGVQTRIPVWAIRSVTVERVGR
jgi:hypothetical protein